MQKTTTAWDPATSRVAEPHFRSLLGWKWDPKHLPLFSAAIHAPNSFWTNSIISARAWKGIKVSEAKGAPRLAGKGCWAESKAGKGKGALGFFLSDSRKGNRNTTFREATLPAPWGCLCHLHRPDDTPHWHWECRKQHEKCLMGLYPVGLSILLLLPDRRHLLSAMCCDEGCCPTAQSWRWLIRG